MKYLLVLIFSLVSATAALAQTGYQIRPGDILQVEVLQDPSLNRQVLVLPDGSVNFPIAGSVSAQSLTAGQVQERIAAGIASNFAVAPDVFVTVAEIGAPVATGVGRRMIDVYFLGEFATPGVAELPRGSTLLQAMALGGGFTNFAALNRVQLRRTNPHTGESSVAVIDFRAISNGASLSADPVLADGDVILLPQRRLFE